MNDFQRDYRERINPELTTRLLAEAVPVMKDVEFRYLEVKKGYCKSMLPLNRKSSNQHGTHQALIMGLSGDYTGGLALASLIPDEPILGVHEITPDRGMSLWLIRSDMQYFRPSTDDVFVEASIPEEMGEMLNKRYHKGRMILLDVLVTFKDIQQNEIAKGTFRYFCKKKNSLAVVKKGNQIDVMFEHVLKTSAKLIAQLRAVETEKAEPLFIDEISVKVAGKQGKVIADRFMQLLPELQNMVAARTFHLDQSLKTHSSRMKNVIFIGAGLDFRMYRHPETFGNVVIFEMDLSEMLIERSKLERQHELRPEGFSPPVKIGCNFLSDSISEKLMSNGFSPEEPSFYIFEGCSMYFSEEENIKIIGEISGMMEKNPDSILWMDMVDSRAVLTDKSPDEIRGFLSNMAKLGEPFVYGFEDDSKVLNKVQLGIIEKKYTTDCMMVELGEVYSLYSFNLLQYTAQKIIGDKNNRGQTTVFLERIIGDRPSWHSVKPKHP